MLDQNSLLSLDRTIYAAERTLMSWIRTAFSMISFGFTMGKFLEYLQSQPGRHSRLGEGDTLPKLLILLGLVSLVVGIVNFRHEMQRLKRLQNVRYRAAPVGIIAALVLFLGVLAFAGLFVSIDFL